jgi:hypothetical protein
LPIADRSVPAGCGRLIYFDSTIDEKAHRPKPAQGFSREIPQWMRTR